MTRSVPWLALVAMACSDSGGAAGGGACAECVEEKCSDLLPACRQDPDCDCMVDCLGERGVVGVPDCLGECGLDDRPTPFLQVEECTAVACPDEGDECSTPDDWTPPEEPIACDPTGAGLGGGELADCAFDRDLTFDADAEVLQLESEDGTICLRLERREEGPGALANTDWTLLAMQVGPVGEVALVDDPDDLCWYSSHHNFRDWAHAWTGTRHFDLVLHEDGHGGGRTYTLYGFEAGPLEGGSCGASADGSQCVEEPTDLIPVP